MFPSTLITALVLAEALSVTVKMKQSYSPDLESFVCRTGAWPCRKGHHGLCFFLRAALGPAQESPGCSLCGSPTFCRFLAPSALTVEQLLRDPLLPRSRLKGRRGMSKHPFQSVGQICPGSQRDRSSGTPAGFWVPCQGYVLRQAAKQKYLLKEMQTCSELPAEPSKWVTIGPSQPTYNRDLFCKGTCQGQLPAWWRWRKSTYAWNRLSQ